MPWSEKDLRKLREEFVRAYTEGKATMTGLCQEYGISRKTGYKWVGRYHEGQELGDRSRRPEHTPTKISPAIEKLIVQARMEHPAWGANKLLKILERQGVPNLPSVSTVGNILRRNSLISPQVSQKHHRYKRFARENPNELWQMDFKGDFLLANAERCYPLTVLDDCSRYSLCLKALPSQRWDGVKQVLTGLFEQYGLPWAMLSDNGPPWGNGQSGGMTKFDVWLMLLDVLPIHGRALHPQTQGKEERFHRTMDDELLSMTRLDDMTDAQQKFDAFREEYNSIRPHQALGYDTPSVCYTVSSRAMPHKLEEPLYDSGVKAYRVRGNGTAKVNGAEYYIGSPMAAHFIAVEELSEHCIRFRFGNYEIAKFNLIDNCFSSRKIYRL